MQQINKSQNIYDTRIWEIGKGQGALLPVSGLQVWKK